MERHLRTKDGREPSSVEIALELEMSVVEVEQIRRASQTPVSLANPVGEPADAELGDLLTDESDQLPDEQVESILRNETLRRLLETLPSRERQILERRYGLDGGDPATLDELRRTFNITRERIRQLEKKSLTKLQVLARGEPRHITNAGARRRLCRRAASKPERCSLGVAADHPALAGVNDLAAERLHALDRGGEVGDREIREREAVAWAGAALVQPEHDPCILALPAAALLWSPVGERRPEQALPELSRPFRLVGGKLDQESRRQRSHGTAAASPIIDRSRRVACPWASS